MATTKWKPSMGWGTLHHPAGMGWVENFFSLLFHAQGFSYINLSRRTVIFLSRQRYWHLDGVLVSNITEQLEK
jgi:hypothetical protein